MRLFTAVLPLLLSATLLSAAESGVIYKMDDISAIRMPDQKGRAEVVPGKTGSAVKFSYDDKCNNKYFRMKGPVGTPEWDKADGISFWVKGDGSNHLGSFELIWNENYALRYACAFSINSTEWKKVIVPWNDFIPEKPVEGALYIDPEKGNAPSKFTAFWIGKWWYWRDYAAYSFTIDDVRLAYDIPKDTTDYTPKGAPLARTLARLKAHKPITVVTMGDSLTDYGHWANRNVKWPDVLASGIKQAYRSDVTIDNPAIGGTELRNNLVLIPRWAERTPEPDLVTICFGYNDWGSGMRGPMFKETLIDAVQRIRRITKGKSDVLIITTCPAVERWTTMAELSQACRDAAKATNAGIADTYAAFHEAGKTNKEALYVDDKVHLSANGHKTFAATVLEAIKNGGR